MQVATVRDTVTSSSASKLNLQPLLLLIGFERGHLKFGRKRRLNTTQRINSRQPGKQVARLHRWN